MTKCVLQEGVVSLCCFSRVLRACQGLSFLCYSAGRVSRPFFGGDNRTVASACVLLAFGMCATRMAPLSGWCVVPTCVSVVAGATWGSSLCPARIHWVPLAAVAHPTPQLAGVCDVSLWLHTTSMQGLSLVLLGVAGIAHRVGLLRGKGRVCAAA